MASTDGDEFVTCCVCTYKYDEEVRKPKYLTCSHTMCVCCLTEILQDGIIKCPVCRQESQVPLNNCSDLSNNKHALYILKLEKQKSETSKIARECYEYLKLCGIATDEQRQKLEEYLTSILNNLHSEVEETTSWRNNKDLDVLIILINQFLDLKDVADSNFDLMLKKHLKRGEIYERLDLIMNPKNETELLPPHSLTSSFVIDFDLLWSLDSVHDEPFIPTPPPSSN